MRSLIAFESWSLIIGCNYSELTGKILVFWKIGRLGEVVGKGDSTVCLTYFI